jgi:hypothetical protein
MTVVNFSAVGESAANKYMFAANHNTIWSEPHSKFAGTKMQTYRDR